MAETAQIINTACVHSDKQKICNNNDRDSSQSIELTNQPTGKNDNSFGSYFFLVDSFYIYAF